MIRVPQLIRRAKKPTRARSPVPAGQTPAELQLAYECSPHCGAAGFIKFCAEAVQILSKDSETGVVQNVIPFVLFDCQKATAADLVAGLWLIVLKARQLGLTWLVAAFVVWKMVYQDFFQAMCIAQPGGYAEEFVYRVRFIIDRLPTWCAPTVTKEPEGTIRLANGSNLRVLAPGTQLSKHRQTGRSFTGDFALIDEGAFVPGMREILRGLIPSLTRSAKRAKDGQIAVVTTSDGPEGEFAELWRETYGDHGETLNDAGVGPNNFKVWFFNWRSRPGRDDAWYEKQLAILGPIGRKREYPETIEEAFEHALGRVYAKFTRARNVGDIEVPDYAQRGRAVDWGESKSAYVVLWYAYIPGPPGLLISPQCPNCIREHIGWRLDDKGRPSTIDDHTCDAVRYAVVRHNLRGLVYVYKEVYRKDSVEQGWNPITEIAEIHKESGWVPAGPGMRRKYVRGRHGERYDLPLVADRSMGKMINLFNEFDVPTVPSPTIAGMKQKGSQGHDRPFEEVIEGVKMVAALIDGTEDLDHFYAIRRQPGGPEEIGALLRAAAPIIEGKVRAGRSDVIRRLIEARRKAGGARPETGEQK